MELVAREDLLPYREYTNLSTFIAGSIHKVHAIG